MCVTLTVFKWTGGGGGGNTGLYSVKVCIYYSRKDTSLKRRLKLKVWTYVKFSENLLITFRKLTENINWLTFLTEKYKSLGRHRPGHRSGITSDFELFICLDREAFQLVCRHYTIYTTHYTLDIKHYKLHYTHWTLHTAEYKTEDVWLEREFIRN